MAVFEHINKYLADMLSKALSRPKKKLNKEAVLRMLYHVELLHNSQLHATFASDPQEKKQRYAKIAEHIHHSDTDMSLKDIQKETDKIRKEIEHLNPEQIIGWKG